MKKNRKLDKCLNCDQSLNSQENFCPECGQKNMDQKVSLNVFIHDFFSNYLSFDTSFFRTTKPFLLQPGKLTREFNSGKRNYYIHPIRLYLISSLFYFFVVGFVVPVNSLDQIMSGISSGKNVFQRDIQKQLSSVDQKERQEIDSILSKNKLSALLPTAEKDSLIDENDTAKAQVKKWSYLKAAALDSEVSNTSFEKILKQQRYTISGLSIEKQRDIIANSNLYLTKAIRNLPLMMFLLLPFFAAFLMFLYMKNKKYYVEHLIHGLHLHSFAYFFYGLGIILMFNLENIEEWVFMLSFSAVSLYAFLSLKRVYQNGFFKSLVKFFVLGFAYFFLLMFALLLELYISLIML